MIGCATVQNHTLLVRRNGIPVVSGNSYESYYQSVRRCWRYGQTKPVTVDVVWTEGEVRIKERLRRKCARADDMYAAIVANMRDARRLTVDHDDTTIIAPRWLCSTA